MSDALVVALCVVAGLLVAPFLTTLIDEVPHKRPVRWPSLREHPPVLYWVRAPAAPPASSAPGDVVDDEAEEVEDEVEGAGGPLTRGGGIAVELLTPVLFALAGVRFGVSAVVVPFCVLFASLLVVSVIDIEHYRIPDRIVFPTLALSLPLIVVVSLGLGLPETIGYALVGAGTYFALLFVAHLVYPAGMGFGDVKLALVMGLFLGWLAPDPIRAITLVLFGLMIGCVVGVVVGGALALIRRKNAAFPFGPALAASTVIAVLFSNQILGLD
ncbi:MAG: prepilin peptidase [Acidimicrobiales bacterium]|nr:prepilin peptidase [Acidimicrobiales bacterium]